MINLMQRLAELDAKNPKIVKEAAWESPEEKDEIAKHTQNFKTAHASGDTAGMEQHRKAVQVAREKARVAAGPRDYKSGGPPEGWPLDENTPGRIKYDEMRNKIVNVIIKLYDQPGATAETIKQMGDRVATHLGYDPEDPIFQDAWIESFTDADLSGAFDKEPEDDYTDYSMRQGERGNPDQRDRWNGDEQGDDMYETKGNQMENLNLASLRMLSGIKTKMKECGIPMLGGMSGQSSIPASITATAGSGRELSDMLKDIMSLAGVKPVTQNDMPIEPTATSTPVAKVGQPDMKDLMAMVTDEPDAEIDGMNDGDDFSQDNEPEDESLSGSIAGGTIGAAAGGPIGAKIGSEIGDELTDEDWTMDNDVEMTGKIEINHGNRPYDNSPSEKMGQDGVRQFGDMGAGGTGDRMDGNAPKAQATDMAESLFAQYKKFVAEAGPDKKDVPAWKRKEKGGDWKVSKSDLEKEKDSRISDPKTLAKNSGKKVDEAADKRAAIQAKLDNAKAKAEANRKAGGRLYPIEDTDAEIKKHTAALKALGESKKSTQGKL